ncbi:glycoside hydrolase/deacetylase [Panus rudis PR-1116 ss-1]|nr:glycoside hydrolase/deacetylase [Panus rudis PR-1116 ss-1]
MRLALLSALAVPALVSAAHNHHARQAPPASSASASAPASSGAPASAPAASGSSAASGSVPASGVSGASSTPISTLPTVSFSLISTNPTAVPLTAITPGTITTGFPTQVTTTEPAGASPTFLPNAPPLPDLSTVLPANYPALDQHPPTDSPEVQQWIKDVQSSGVEIPNIEPTVAGGCPANPQAATDSSRCWWTCGGCIRDTDVVACPDKLTWGLTHDDGPAPFTPNLMQYLDEVQLKTTFFVVGSRAISYPNLLREQYMAQHQIAVHTWSHPPMTTMTNEQVIAELGWTKKVIKDVLGVTPTYWRPPYGDIDDRVRAISKAMGLTPVMWTRISAMATFDTGDFDVAGGTESPSQVLQNWQNILGNATQMDTGFIVLEHDLFSQSVDIATGYILPDALAFQPKLKIEPVISCLNKPLSDAYVETNDNATNPLAPTGSQPVTFSSGAPGSAEATGGSSSGNNGNSNGAVGNLAGGINQLALAVAGTAVAGFVAGASLFL